ncbi:TonB-dependent receptor [Novosphingobium sp.]|uniref:TonB-dependent receptor n=1 Tax=Novosphingobium sp. TaxID=1874826 RepID=UPI002732D715|nr:TonB-dependent receptor [Novosphingobium sp.]MDP3907620.1 TonB-dependent receptor [Novosphingobium sp.]
MHTATRRAVIAALFASTALSAAPAFAQEAAADAVDANEIVVTAQKRSESLQKVPISIQALGTAKLEELNISDFKGYAQQLPSVSFQSSGTPGNSVIYMRGVASGGDGNHSGSLPSVGVYFDEQPVTTIGGNLDVHIYDIARIESLSGPQGTLYGASSEAGTIRIITNKPDTSGFAGSVDGEINTVKSGDFGGKLEGMINAPLSDNAALRVVGFYRRDGGYIDNIAGTRTFCGTTLFDGSGGLAGCLRDGISVNNARYVEKNYNDTESYGARAALKVDLDDNWTVTPTVMYQNTKSNGSYGYDDSLGDLQVQHFFPEHRSDKFIQAALTIEGKIGNWDVTYAGAYLDRKTFSSSDYTDYAEAYDSLYESVGGLAYYFAYTDALGNTNNPSQLVIGSDHFKKLSQELRFSSPADKPLRMVAGAFFQRQSNDIFQDYQIPGLGPLMSVNGNPGTLWLTKQHRVDKDYALFGEVSYDLMENLTLTAGVRGFKYDNTLIGFFGFGRNPGNGYTDTPYNGAWSSRTGVAGCFTTTGDRLRNAIATGGALTFAPGAIAGTPCTNLGTWAGGKVNPVQAKGDGATYRFNLNWKPTNTVMVYGTVSKGFRPGGINRRADVAPYAPDFLINFELGWKTTLAPGLRFNGAVYQQEWKDFQFSFLGANSFTEIHNGPDARIKGVEMDLTYNGGGLFFNLAGSYTDARTLQNLCMIDDPTYTCTGPGNMVSAPKGIRLPITPRWKLSSTLRYTADMGSVKPYGQLNVAYQSKAASDIRTAVYETFSGNVISPAANLGDLEQFATVNVAVGADIGKLNLEFFVANLFDERGQLSRFQQCGSCAQRGYVVPITPRTFGLRAGIDF